MCSRVATGNGGGFVTFMVDSIRLKFSAGESYRVMRGLITATYCRPLPLGGPFVPSLRLCPLCALYAPSMSPQNVEGNQRLNGRVSLISAMRSTKWVSKARTKGQQDCLTAQSQRPQEYGDNLSASDTLACNSAPHHLILWFSTLDRRPRVQRTQSRLDLVATR